MLFQIVGTYNDGVTGHGFLLDENGSPTVDVPGATFTNAIGIRGQFRTIDFPDAPFTQAIGINSLDEIVGVYTLAGTTHGFLLSGGQLSTVDFPDATFTRL